MNFMYILEWCLAHWEELSQAVVTVVSMVTALMVMVKTKKWNKLITFVKEVMAEADTFKNFTGPEKKAFVMTKANQWALKHGIKFNSEKVSKAIEDLIKLTKQVNGVKK